MDGLDAHERPPEQIRRVYKRLHKLPAKSLDLAADVISTTDIEAKKSCGYLRCLRVLKTSAELCDIFAAFHPDAGASPRPSDWTAPNVYEHGDVPGLFIIPSLLSEEAQVHLVDRLFHRDLSLPIYKTNLDLHYDLLRPPPEESYFSLPSCTIYAPRDADIHKPLTVRQVLEKKLRWMTLGGQYDWTAKQYPKEQPPPFPADIADLLSRLFPSFRAEAAIVNLYSPGDTLSLHRDVSESCDAGLVSISLGCDGIFLISTGEASAEDGEIRTLTLRLCSGDAVFMTGKSRFAWHGVPKIVEGTCPDYLRDWPATAGGEFEQWRGWMAGKRVNLNARQMFESALP